MTKRNAGDSGDQPGKRQTRSMAKLNADSSGGLDKRQTRSMTERNAKKSGGHNKRQKKSTTITKRNANRQPRPNGNGHNNVAGVAPQPQIQQRSTAAAAAASTNLIVATTSRPAAISSVSNLKSYQHSGKVDNIDERDKDDPLCATDYVQEMYNHFRGKEDITSARPVYMENQSHINERMRAYLVDWLVEVHLKFKLVPETLYLTVNLIDRYLSHKKVEYPKLPLVGLSCLHIASKYEDGDNCVTKSDLQRVSGSAFSGNGIVSMEGEVLTALEYKVTIASSHCFLARYLKAAHANKRIVQSSCMLLDGSLSSYKLLEFQPSQVAAAAVLLARLAAGRHAWSPTLLAYTGYCEEDVLPVARALLAEKDATSPELRAVHKKYSSPRYGRIATTEVYTL